MRKDKFEYKILLIEDNPGDVLLIDEYLHDQIINPQILHVATFNAARELLSDPNLELDIILLDLSLPDKKGEELIIEILSLSNDTPVIVLTGYTDIDFSMKSLELGVSDYLLKDVLNGFTLYKSLIHNIARKQFIVALQNSEKRYNDLFHFSPQPMMVIEKSTYKILDVNDAAIRHYEFSHEEFLNFTILDLSTFASIERTKEIFQQLEASFSGYLGDFKHRKANNSCIDVELHLNPLDFSGRPAFILQANDISDRLHHIKAIEQQNEKLSNISWMQSHVVRAPVARLLALIELIKVEQDVAPEEMNLYLNEIIESAEELDTVIREISNKATTINFIKN
ncbi:response regulator [Christiangramia aquimixticola]|uniref:response regulator n=1 Tax=Christiangramia aquimixticola TaxID=1697558 RepID=UPI003AA8FDF4